MPRPLRILVVDDNFDAADTLAVMVRTWGYDTRTAFDAKAAIAEAAYTVVGSQPDVAIAVLPESALHVGTGPPSNAPPDRELGGTEDLGMRPAQHAGDVARAQVRSRFGQRMAGHPPGRDAAPGQRGQGRGLRDHGRTFSLARPTSVTSERVAPEMAPAGSGRSGVAVAMEISWRSTSHEWHSRKFSGQPYRCPSRRGQASLLANSGSARQRSHPSVRLRWDRDHRSTPI